MKRNLFTVLVFLLIACSTVKQEASVPDELDRVIREASDYINENVPAGSKLVILNIKSSYPPLSEYIIDVLTENVVNDRIFTVVDRANLSLIQQEMNFQLSGEVSDESAQSIGQKLGAQTIVSGSLTAFGNLWRLTVRALGVEGATVQGMFNRNIPNGVSIAALTSGEPAAVTFMPAAPARTQTASSSGVKPASPAIAPPPVPAASAEPPGPAAYKAGDRGPAGGIIFYDKGMFFNDWQYLEAAPADLDGAQWAATDLGIRGTGTAVGTGKRNTELIVEQLGIGTAAQLCDALEFGGYNDWFLPSQDELDLMYRNLKQRGLGNFLNSEYWSSSYDSSRVLGHTSWGQNFSNGSKIYMWQDKVASVRAVRAF